MGYYFNLGSLVDLPDDLLLVGEVRLVEHEVVGRLSGPAAHIDHS